MHDLVIFDCDGVLVDSELLSNRCLVDNLRRYGLDLSLSDSIGFFMGGTITGVRNKALELGADLPDDWIDEIYAEMYDRLRAGCPAVDGVAELLDHLDTQEIPFCVASNGREAKMKITLGQNDLWERFQDRMFSAHTHGTAKPDPGLFQIAARHFEAKEPVVIEDSQNGVTAAMRAGMRCLAYAAHSDSDDLSVLGAEVFTHMNQVPGLLARAPQTC